jgi:hypothetical protein
MLRYRYLPRDSGPLNPDGLPVGFVADPGIGRTWLGLTCAACHTAEIQALTPEAQFQDCADTAYGIASKYGPRHQQAMTNAWKEVGISVSKIGLRPKKVQGAGPAASPDVELREAIVRAIGAMSRLRDTLPA